ncbi:MAG: phosphate ABC transporter ATP-binding protein PstB [Pseudomonadota bacterium]
MNITVDPAPADINPTAASDDIAIQVRDLNFFYGKSHALHDINAQFARRKVKAMMGPSGSGKSTLLRIFNRMYALYPEQKVKGEVLIDGTNILARRVDANDLRRRVGMVFQRPTPFPMSIYDNVAFGPRRHLKLDRAALEERVEWALRKAALWDEVKDKLKQPGTALSGGQQQRLCIARTVALKPEVLLLDEPTSALDPVSTQKVEELVCELKSDFTIVLVSHNVNQARRVADETVFMEAGRIIEEGLTAELFENPKDHRTKNFMQSF